MLVSALAAMIFRGCEGNDVSPVHGIVQVVMVISVLSLQELMTINRVVVSMKARALA